MISKLQELLDQIRELEERVSEEVSREAEQFGYSIQQGRVSFECEIARHHKALATKLRTYLAESSWLAMATAPLVYGMALPLLVLDLFVWMYQLTCFPIYRIPRVRRSDFIVMDRHRLQYLNLIERLHCIYCGYATGLLAYVREVGARTEQYWCPVKHARRIPLPHSRYHRFTSYGDAEHYAAQLEALRRQLREHS